MRLRRRGVAIAAVVLVAAIVYLSLNPPPPALPAGSLASLDAELQATPEGQEAAKTTTEDAAKIEAVAGVLRRGRAVEEHKCGETGRLTFHLRDGSSAEFELLAGHGRRYYEYRTSSGICRVDRQVLVRAVAGLGLGDLDPGSPSR